MLTLSEVDVAYGRVRAVQGLSINVQEGELVGLVGHNGAGKTTTLMAITGVLSPSGGEINFSGRNLRSRTPDDIVRMGVSLVPEGRRIFSRLTVGENLMIGGLCRSDRRQVKKDIDGILERFPVLGQAWSKSGALLSGGEQQQLAIARGLLAAPRLLVLDEPTLGLAPKMVDRVFELLTELHQEGMTILLVEQNATRTIEVANRSYVLRSGGRLQGEGTAAELAGLENFETSYIGMA